MREEVAHNDVTKQAEQVAATADHIHDENAAIDLAVRKNFKRNFAQNQSKVMIAILRGLTFLMKLDIWLFGRLQTGPYFIVLKEK